MSLPNPTDRQERQFTFNGFTYHAQLWGDPNQKPVIALHGWLDNSASFDLLCPQLEGAHVLAIDLAGHGLSDRRDGYTDYPLWTDFAALYAIADEMGWEQFALLGHSRGAMMSLLMAGVYPERITHLMMIDAFLPPLVEAHTAVERMVSSIEETQRRLDRKLSLYTDFDDAIAARCYSKFASITEDSAKLLATRGLREIDGQFHWHADGKLWAPSNVALSLEQVTAFINKITAPSLLLLGSEGLFKDVKKDTEYYRLFEKFLEQLKTEVKTFEDGHFLHMEKSVTEVAQSVQQFLSSE